MASNRALGRLLVAVAFSSGIGFLLEAGNTATEWTVPVGMETTRETLRVAQRAHALLLRANLLRIADGQQRLEPTVTICLVTVPNRFIMDVAKTLTSQMFARIRVRLQWYGPCPAGAADPIFVTFQTRTPEAQLPGALGVALPLEGSQAWVFYDRVLRAGPEHSRRVVALLAHVMAHEIAHLLQGISRHSESGILKAHWSDTDSARMVSFPLMFTPEDAILIHHGLEERHARLVSSGFAGAMVNHSDEIGARKEKSLLVP